MLALLLKKRGELHVLHVSHCQLETIDDPPRAIESFTLVYSKPDSGPPVVCSFTLNHVEITDPRLVMEVIFFYHATGLHTKSHLFSNGLTEYIFENRLETLLPSTEASIPLHNGLMYSDFSPVTTRKSRGSAAHMLVGHLYSTWITRESLAAEATNFSAFKNHTCPSSQVPFVEYLKASRSALRTILREHGLEPGLLEPLFNHMIVHNIDHEVTYSFTWDLNIGVKMLAAKPGLYERFRSLLFRWQIGRPGLLPLSSNRIRDSTLGFYRDVYLAMRRLDAEYGYAFADGMTASVMF